MKARRKKILLVDDDADFVEINRVVLQENGYEVSVACNGEECIEKARADKPDLIVLDVMMTTRSDGFNVSHHLRNSEQTKGIPLIMVTAVNDTVPFKFEPDKTWLPVDAFLEKPVEPSRLLEEISKWLGVPCIRGE